MLFPLPIVKSGGWAYRYEQNEGSDKRNAHQNCQYNITLLRVIDPKNQDPPVRHDEQYYGHYCYHLLR